MKTESAQKNTASVFDVDRSHVGVLDGVRAIAVLCVLWFHFWQQTWLMPVYQTPFLNWLGVKEINPDVIRRTGCLFVDMMLLLSAFVLYLPIARSTYTGTKPDSVKRFYQKRIARIVPSYLFAVVVMFIVALIEGKYAGKAGFAFKDLITHLTFTQMLFNDTYLFTAITAVMWTVCVEVAFYLLFPMLSRAFRAKPLLTYATMVLVGELFTLGVAPAIGEPRVMVNRFLTFLPVFANGMMAAHLYVLYAERVKKKAVFSILGTLAAIAAVYVMLRLFHMCVAAGKSSDQQTWQMRFRPVLSLAFTALLLGAAISPKPIRKLLDNRVLASIAAVSYHLYLWHQWIIVHICTSFGAKSGADISAKGANFQWTVTLTGLATAFIVAILLTYGLERPISKRILKHRKEN